MKLNNRYFLIRHGQAVSNIKNIVSSEPEKNDNPLTDEGVVQVEKTAELLEKQKIDLIFCSPLLRTKQTAQIVANKIMVQPEIVDELKEIGFGIFNGGPIENFTGYFIGEKDIVKEGAPEGESYADVLERVFRFFEGLEKEYKNKRILLVSHQCPLFLLESKIQGFTLNETVERPWDDQLLNGQARELKQETLKIRTEEYAI